MPALRNVVFGHVAEDLDPQDREKAWSVPAYWPLSIDYRPNRGDGPQRLADGNAAAPFNDLAIKYVLKDFATAIDIATAVSTFACVIGSLNAACLLFALGRDRLAPRIGEVNAARGTPGAAIVLSGTPCLLGILVWAPFVGAADHYGDLASIGTLALILVYVGVTGAELAESLRARPLVWALFGLGGMLTLRSEGCATTGRPSPGLRPWVPEPSLVEMIA